MQVSPLTSTPANAAQTERAAASLAMGGNKKALAALPHDQQVKAVAGQFEAILLRQFLQDSVGKLAGGESGGAGIYGYLMTDVLSNKLSEGGGLGLSKVFAQQLSPHAAAHAAAPAQNNKP